jgi:hypothetical protein
VPGRRAPAGPPRPLHRPLLTNLRGERQEQLRTCTCTTHGHTGCILTVRDIMYFASQGWPRVELDTRAHSRHVHYFSFPCQTRAYSPPPPTPVSAFSHLTDQPSSKCLLSKQNVWLLITVRAISQCLKNDAGRLSFAESYCYTESPKRCRGPVLFLPVLLLLLYFMLLLR